MLYACVCDCMWWLFSVYMYHISLSCFADAELCNYNVPCSPLGSVASTSCTGFPSSIRISSNIVYRHLSYSFIVYFIQLAIYFACLLLSIYLATKSTLPCNGTYPSFKRYLTCAEGNPAFATNQNFPLEETAITSSFLILTKCGAQWSFSCIVEYEALGCSNSSAFQTKYAFVTNVPCSLFL